MSLKFIAFGDIDANAPLMMKFISLNFDDYDFVLYVGDMASSKSVMAEGMERMTAGAQNMHKVVDPFEYFPKRFPEELKDLTKINESLKALKEKTRVIGVWGNADLFPLIQKAGIDQNIEIIHNKKIKIKDYNIVGYSGRPFYNAEVKYPDKVDKFGMLLQEGSRIVNYAFSEEDVYDDISKLLDVLDTATILVSHVPPYKINDTVFPKNIELAIKTYGNMASEGNVGSPGIRKIIDKYNPVLHLFGHIHEEKGISVIGRSTFINCGSFSQNREYADVTIKNNEIKAVWKNIDDWAIE